MNITSPILAGAARVVELPSESATSLLKISGNGTGLFDDSPDGGLGMTMSALAGVAAALAVAILLSIYFRSGYRSRRDLIKHGLAVSAVLALLAFVISDMRHAALAYLGINPAKPAVEFEIRLPKATLSAVSDAPDSHDVFAIACPEISCRSILAEAPRLDAERHPLQIIPDINGRV